MPREQEPWSLPEPHGRAPAGDWDPARPERVNIDYLRELRRRRTPRDRLRFWLVLAAVVAFHLLLVLFVGVVMRLRAESYAMQRGQRVGIQLFAPEEHYAPPPELALPSPPGAPHPPAPPQHLHFEPRAPGSMSATLKGVQGPPLRLYGPEGQVNLPPGTGQGRSATPAYQAPQPQRSPIMQSRTPVPYHATRFDKDWAPSNESLGAKAFRKAVDATTAQKTIKLPGGGKLHCVASPLLLLFGCGPQAPPPPPKNDNDIRLSMPPPETLTGKKITLPAHASTAARAAPSPPGAITLPPAGGTAPKPAAASTAARPARAGSVPPPASGG
jgi:hypothetical protein